MAHTITPLPLTVPAWHGLERPAPLSAREARAIVADQLGDTPTTKDAINAELLGEDWL